MPTIVLTGGGSGGHITPLLSLARALKDQQPGCRVIYIGVKGEKLEGLQERYGVFDQVRLIPAGKFRRYHGQSFLAHLADVRTQFLNGRDFLRGVRGVRASRKLLRQLRPDVVFSKGGYVAVPVGIAAHRLGIPIITHDSDAVPGLANRILSRWAVVHAVGQPVENYDYPKDSTRFTGIPVDERVQPVTASRQKAFKKELGLPVDALVLLVAGGGLGSKLLNDLTVAMAPELLAEFDNAHIILITGQRHQAEAEKQIADLDRGRVKVIGFTPDFYRYSGAADVIVCRAGASTLAEFAIQGKACVVAPAAQLTGGHQLANVKQLQSLKAAEVLTGDISPQRLLGVVSKLFSDERHRRQMAVNLSSLAKPEAAGDLARLILEQAGVRGL